MSEWGRASGSPVGSGWKARDMEEHRQEMAEEVERDHLAETASRKRPFRLKWRFWRRSGGSG